MADTEVEKTAPTHNVHTPEHSLDGADIDIPKGWMYKRPKLGPLRLSWYASPESQLVLVAFVCFLCPGEHRCVSVARIKV